MIIKNRVKISIGGICGILVGKKGIVIPKAVKTFKSATPLNNWVSVKKIAKTNAKSPLIIDNGNPTIKSSNIMNKVVNVAGIYPSFK